MAVLTGTYLLMIPFEHLTRDAESSESRPLHYPRVPRLGRDQLASLSL